MTGLGMTDGRRGEPDDEAYDDDLREEEAWGEGEDGELELSDDDEPLPWLESDDYEDEHGHSGIGRLILIAVIGLLLIGAALWALWYLGSRPDSDLTADGGTIEAPEEAMKERPEDPGGKEFEGTGDVAPAVGQGETREGRLAESETPRPSVDAAGSQTDRPASSGGVGVQVGAFSTRSSADQGWAYLNRQTDALSGFDYRVMEGQIDSGTVYRLQAVASDAASARSLCATLKSQGIACQVKD